jgi:hypothetical protein
MSWITIIWSMVASDLARLPGENNAAQLTPTKPANSDQ